MKLFATLLTLISLVLFFTGSTFAADKRIQIDLTTQQLYAYNKDRLIYNFPVSSGKWYPTPTGSFKPWAKLPFTRMKGGNPALGTYYNLPQVPYVVYFYKGYAIHGAYWHNNFGHPMSHGCVNVSVKNAALLYNFIELDTPIVIAGLTPKT